MRFKSIISLIYGLHLAAIAYAADEGLRVYLVRESVFENILTDVHMAANQRPYTRTNNYTRTIYYPGARLGDCTVAVVNLEAQRVELMCGTNSVNLIIKPGIQTNRSADLISLSTHSRQRVMVGDQLANGSIVTDITTNNSVIAQTSEGSFLLIPALSEEEKEQMRPQPGG